MAASASTSFKPIHCAIVEDHCDILPFLDACVRAKKLPIKDVCFLHFDSHPDLSIPSDSSTSEWFEKGFSSKILESKSGISEFLIPLLFTNRLAEVIWVKPEWCNQFPCGPHRFVIGDAYLGDGNIAHMQSSAKAAICTVHAAYFLDDGVACDNEEFIGATHEALIDIQSPHPVIHDRIESDTDIPSSWILDICLDYFVVANPFIVELGTMLSVTDITESTKIIENIVLFFKNLRWREFTSSTCCCDTCVSIRGKNVKFRRGLRKDFFQSLDVLIQMDQFDTSTVEQVSAQIFGRFYCANEQDTIEKFISTWILLTPSVRKFICDSNFQFLLPHQSLNDAAEIAFRVFQFKEYLLSSKFAGVDSDGNKTLNQLPAAITIAKSAVDGFTPAGVVDTILNGILDALEEIFSNTSKIDRRKWDSIIIHDLTVDPIEKCVDIFLNRHARRYCKREE